MRSFSKNVIKEYSVTRFFLMLYFLLYIIPHFRIVCRRFKCVKTLNSHPFCFYKTCYEYDVCKCGYYEYNSIHKT